MHEPLERRSRREDDPTRPKPFLRLDKQLLCEHPFCRSCAQPLFELLVRLVIERGEVEMLSDPSLVIQVGRLARRRCYEKHRWEFKLAAYVVHDAHRDRGIVAEKAPIS